MADDPVVPPAAGSAHPLDDALVAAINDAFDAEPIPADLSRFALEAIQWRLVDDELANLAFDSSTDELIAIRGTKSQRRSVRFEGRGISVSVNLGATSLVASIDPPGVFECVLEGPHVMVATTSDADGQIAIDDIATPLRLIVETPAGRLVSPWMTG